MNAEIIAVGSELLTPNRIDTNSLYLTEQLNQLGIDVIFKSVVGDNLRRLVAATQHALFRSDVLIFSGGSVLPKTTSPAKPSPKLSASPYTAIRKSSSSWKNVSPIAAGR